MSPQTATVIVAVISAITSSSFISLVLYFLQRRDRKRDEENSYESAQSRMLLGLGHDRIIALTDHYVRRGGITLKEKRNLEYLYRPYVDLKGNGDCEIGYNACQELSVISDDKAEELDRALTEKEEERHET